MFLYSFCHFGRLIEIAQLVVPRSILGQMPLDIRHQIAHALPSVMAGHCPSLGGLKPSPSRRRL
jgi:hypothetical protein